MKKWFLLSLVLLLTMLTACSLTGGEATEDPSAEAAVAQAGTQESREAAASSATEPTEAHSDSEIGTTLDYGYDFHVGDTYKEGTVVTMNRSVFSVFYEDIRYTAYDGTVYEHLQAYDCYDRNEEFINSTLVDADNKTVVTIYAMPGTDGESVREYKETQGVTFRRIYDANNTLLRTVTPEELQATTLAPTEAATVPAADTTAVPAADTTTVPAAPATVA